MCAWSSCCRSRPPKESPNRFWKLGLVVLGFVILGIIYYRMRG